MTPAYLKLYKTGQLKSRIEQAHSLLESCSLCPRKCHINRLSDERGFCKTGLRARVYSYAAHFGEEPVISGYRGSGTVFFSGCNMACVYCQNYNFSQLEAGREVESRELAQFMLELQELNCHNINLVTPTHVLPQILEALYLAIPKGLKLPLVYNTGGYDCSEVISLLEDIVDIFLPDMRYAKKEMAQKYSNAKDYPEYNQAAVKQMHKQVPDSEIDKNGIMKRGLIIRHLVLPFNISGTEEIMRFIAKQISTQTHISLMSQYLPCYKAEGFPELSRRITEQEYTEAQKVMQKYSLSNGWIQEKRGLAHFAGTNIKPK